MDSGFGLLTYLIRLGLVELKTYTDAEFIPGELTHREARGSVKTEETRDFMFTAFGRAFRDACAPRAETVDS